MDRIPEISKILNNHGVAVLPTDTVYGIFAKATDSRAVARIFRIKKRDKNKPLQVFLPDIKSIKKYAKLKPADNKIIKKLLPGPYTLVFKLKPQYKKVFSFLPGGTIGIRVIKSPMINRLMKETGSPLCATSANFSGGKTPVLFRDIEKKLLKQCDGYIKDDSFVSGDPSCVVDFNCREVKILRGQAKGRLKVRFS